MLPGILRISKVWEPDVEKSGSQMLVCIQITQKSGWNKDCWAPPPEFPTDKKPGNLHFRQVPRPWCCGAEDHAWRTTEVGQPLLGFALVSLSPTAGSWINFSDKLIISSPQHWRLAGLFSQRRQSSGKSEQRKETWVHWAAAGNQALGWALHIL